MADIPTIITASAALVAAFGGVVLAVSKLGPLVSAVNKVLADHHKRATAAKSKATTQSPVSTSATTDSRLLRKSRILPGIVVLASFIMIVTQLFQSGPATANTVVACTASATVIILMAMVLLTEIILTGILALGFEIGRPNQH